MSQAVKPHLVPGPDHPITITKHPHRVVVSFAGEVIADTHHALSLQEANYPAVLYIPRADANMRLLRRTTDTTHCPYKGDASYFTIVVRGRESVNAVWSYERPHLAMAEIDHHLAFYPDRVDAIEDHT
jgi:uncharacterized protein (DUF427 family)